MPPKVFLSQMFCTTCYLNKLKRFWHIWPRWPRSLTKKSIWFLCYPERMCAQSLKEQFSTFDPSDLDLWPSDPKTNRVPLLPRMNVRTKFEEFELLIGNEKVTDGQTYQPTDRPTDMCKAICPLFFEGGLISVM